VKFPALMVVGLAAVVLCGCGTSYSWRSSVPQGVRTVSVPTFRNDSDVAELGAIATRQVLREFQREGTFAIRKTGEAALEVQGVVKSAKSSLTGYDRGGNLRLFSHKFKAVAEITVVDKRTHKILVDNRQFKAETSFASGQDITTAQRDASGCLAEDLARQVVDCVLNIKWDSHE